MHESEEWKWKWSCSVVSDSIHGIFQARVLERGAIAFSSAFCWDAVNIPGKSLILLCPALKLSWVGSGQSLGSASLGPIAEDRPPPPWALCLRTSSCHSRRGLSCSPAVLSSHSEDLGPPCCPGPPWRSCLFSSTRLSSCLGLSTQDSPTQPWAIPGLCLGLLSQLQPGCAGTSAGLALFPAQRPHSVFCAACCLMTEKCYFIHCVWFFEPLLTSGW